MKLKFIAFISVLAIFVFSCKSKKGGASSSENKLLPGDAQLKAIQTVSVDVTAQTLKEGYDIYVGACTNCHGKKNMYKRTAVEWEKDVNRMAPKTKITDVQKDALWKYIVSMRMSKITVK